MKKILVIDDEQLLRQNFRDYLEDYDYEVVTGQDGEEGLKLFESEKPDAVFVDLNMPRVDGFEVLKVISEKTSEIPIVVISGVGIVSEAIRAVNLGAWDFIAKPVKDLDILSYTLGKVFERSRLIKENREYKELLEEKVKIRTAQLQEAVEYLRNTQVQIIRRLALAGEFKDNETGKHVIRVSKYSEVISKALDLTEEKIDVIARTAHLHDIGKIGIPDNILLKPDKLTDEEFDQMKEHCAYGFKILAPEVEDGNDLVYNTDYLFDFNDDSKIDGQLLNHACNIALYHHEKWDGRGYPYGKKGDSIPIEARITAIADVYDALGTSRPYKEGFSEDKCQSIIRELSGSHFEPDIVSAFFDSIKTILDIKSKWKDK